MKLNPLSDLIIVEPADPESVSAGGIILAPSSQEEAKHGKVLAVGPGRQYDGWQEPMDIRVGDTVLYSKFAKEQFKYRGKTLLTMHQADVIGILND